MVITENMLIAKDVKYRSHQNQVNKLSDYFEIA